MKKTAKKPSSASRKGRAKPVQAKAAIVTLPSLPEIVDRLGAAHLRISKAAALFERTTLADYVWLGVCCLAAQEHHALPADQRGQGRKSVLRRRSDSETSLAVINPQGFLAWLKEALPWCAQPTAYKYIDAAKGAGFTAYSTEAEVRKRITAWIKDWQKRHGKALTLAALVAQGKTVDPDQDTVDKDKQGPSIDKLKYEAIQEFSAHAEQLAAVKDHFSPAEHEAVTNKLANTLHQITGYEWSPVTT